MTMNAEFSRKIELLSLETISEVPMGDISNQLVIIPWDLKFQIRQPPNIGYATAPRNNLSSSLQFLESNDLSNKLFTEIFFRSKLGQVGSLELTKFKIDFGYEQTGAYPSKKSTWRHSIKVEGKGYHSFVEWKVEPFKFEMYSNDPINEIIDDILEVALKGL